MGSSHSQFAPGMVFAVSGAFCAGGGLEALYRRVTREIEFCRHALEECRGCSVMRLRGCRFGMRLRHVRAQAQEVGIMSAAGELSCVRFVDCVGEKEA
jgi:hypothetical protein